VKSFWKSTISSAWAKAFDNRSVPTPERLRELLLTADEAAEMDAAGGQNDAAVLIPLYLDGGDLHAVFTKRRDDLRRHAGEISFPGGRPDFEEEELRTTALREAEEEIGLPRDAVEIVGELPPTGTFVTNYKIHPFVGFIEPGREWELQPSEVEVVLELSLPDLIAGFEMQRLLKKGVPFKTPTYTVDGNFVWGATARILQNLLERLEPVL
jgi:8-oxo-dGTP pyrophosphatase MutT (NUDIX family)